MEKPLPKRRETHCGECLRAWPSWDYRLFRINGLMRSTNASKFTNLSKDRYDFYFKGESRQIAVCTTGVRKSGKKADKAAIARAVKMRAAYFEAVQNKTLQVVSDETE